MSVTAFPSLGVLPEPGGTQTWKGLTCERGQALGRSSRNENHWRKQLFGHPQHMHFPQPSSVAPLPRCSSDSSEGRRPGSHPTHSPRPGPAPPALQASLPSPPSLSSLPCQSPWGLGRACFTEADLPAAKSSLDWICPQTRGSLGQIIHRAAQHSRDKARSCAEQK